MMTIKRAVLFPPFIFICGLWKISEFITIIILESMVVWLAQRLDTDGGNMVSGKKWYKSKTLYLAGGIASIGLAFLELPEVQRFILELPADQKGIALIVVGFLVGGLRVITKQPVEW